MKNFVVILEAFFLDLFIVSWTIFGNPNEDRLFVFIIVSAVMLDKILGIKLN
jgi:hypothetical protein